MKVKVTQKIVKAGHQHVLSVGYCDLQFLLRTRDANYYTTRAEGWAADIYSVGTVAIATGYKPFGDIDPSYELCRLYNGKAQDIWNDHTLKYEEKKEKTAQLLDEFIEAAIKEGKEA
jgi:hypothetical protein